MRELIPSKDVRNYLQKVGRKFNDFERASLIYNSDWSLDEKHHGVLPKQEHQEEFRKSLLDIVIEASQYLLQEK